MGAASRAIARRAEKRSSPPMAMKREMLSEVRAWPEWRQRVLVTQWEVMASVVPPLERTRVAMFVAREKVAAVEWGRGGAVTIKLTGPQETLLRGLAEGRLRGAGADYKPKQVLLSYGLVEPMPALGGPDPCGLRITAQGWAWLEASK